MGAQVPDIPPALRAYLEKHGDPRRRRKLSAAERMRRIVEAHQVKIVQLQRRRRFALAMITLAGSSGLFAIARWVLAQ